MTCLRQAVDDYLDLRRSLGYKLECHSRLLADFVGYLHNAGATTLTTVLAVSWACQSTDGDPVWWSRRLGIVRGFARHLRAFDPDTEVPPVGLLPRRSYRPAPYLYQPQEIAALMDEARSLTTPLRAATFETLIGLVAACGLRPGEALRLDRTDIDWAEGLLTISNTKFNNYAEDVVMPSGPALVQTKAHAGPGSLGITGATGTPGTQSARPAAGSGREAFRGVCCVQGPAPSA